MTKRRVACLVLLTGYVVFLLNLALLQYHSSAPVHNAIPLNSIIHDWREGGRPFVWNFVGNLVAFLPIGMIPSAIRWRRTGVWKAASFSLAFSAMIESIQYITGRRVCDVDDLILNTLGGILGYQILLLSGWLARRGRGGQGSD